MGGPIRTWSFDYLEFAVRWNGLTGEGLPSPLIITTDFDSNDAYLAECRRITAALAADRDPDVEAMLTALTRPDNVLAVFGLVAPDTDEEQAIRVYAVRSGERCLVVDQERGETIYHAAGFTVSEYDPTDWAACVVARLPAIGSGRQAAVPLPEPESGDAESDGIDYTYGRSDYRDSFEDSVFEHHEQFLSRPVAAAGVIDIVQGRSVFGPAGRARRAVGWRDVADDGRYAIVHRKPYMARGVDAASFTALLAEEIEEIQLVIEDERRSVSR
ncbi:ESX secretion-associated protein EspG [Nocardia asiatica]|uniref:ESX secretion-associated protein EspG n=1 Tax=Nocardia asiatica TaxID=209252 RepID=UPI003EE1B2A0